MRPLTNGFDDAAVLVLGPIQRGQGRHSRLGQLILEKMPNQTRHGQQHQAPGTAGPGQPRGGRVTRDTHPTEAGPQQRTQELGSSDPAGCLAGTLLPLGHTVAPSVNLSYKLKV